jgi:hypothetical protein
MATMIDAFRYTWGGGTVIVIKGFLKMKSIW